jgi:hypothetical protein
MNDPEGLFVEAQRVIQRQGAVGVQVYDRGHQESGYSPRKNEGPLRRQHPTINRHADAVIPEAGNQTPLPFPKRRLMKSSMKISPPRAFLPEIGRAGKEENRTSRGTSPKRRAWK